MRRTIAGLASAALLLTTSCDSGDDAPAPPPATFLQGVWTRCQATDAGELGTLDVRTTLSVWGDGYQIDRVAYGGTSNGTCGGTDGFLLDSASGTFTVGAEVEAALGDATVTARAIDLLERRSGVRAYGIAHVDAGAEPDLLYLSELAASAAARPTVLEDGAPFSRIGE